MKIKSLTNREVCDLELLLNGSFFPLDGFLCETDYQSVLKKSRLSNQALWSIPICLAITQEQKNSFEKESKIILQDATGVSIAFLYVEDIYPYSVEKESQAVFGVYDLNHPYQKQMKKNFDKGAKFYIGGKLEQINPVVHYDFQNLRHTPSELKKILEQKKISKVVAFQTRNPMHKSHFYLTLKALQQAGEGAHLLLHPVVGVTQDADVNYFLRVSCYQKIMKYYKGKAVLSLLPLSMRMAGPKEAVWHAQIRKNFGATHFIVGRDHAGPSYQSQNNQNFYEPYQAQELLTKYASEIGITPIYSKAISYIKETNTYQSVEEILKTHTPVQLSGTKQREILEKGEKLPEWFSFPEIINLLQKNYKKKKERGFCVYFVGIPASGKSTLANVLKIKLHELVPYRSITVLDGDIVRKNLSKGLGFSIEDRKINIQRIGYVASEVVKHNGICLVANIAPFTDARLENRLQIQAAGYYIEIYVKTSLQVCIQRDPKGLYQRAIQGEIANLTGYNDIFEEPQKAEITLETDKRKIADCVEQIVLFLKQKELI